MSDDQSSAAKAKGGRLSHGIFSKDVLLAWDDREEFAKLLDGLTLEFFPDGQSELEAVFDLAQLYWQKRTLWRLRTAAVLRDHHTQEILATGEKSWVAIRRALRKKARDDRAVINAMGDTFTTAFSDLSRLTKKIRQEPNTEKNETLTELLGAAIELIRSAVLPQLRKIRKMSDVEDALDKNYVPEDLEKISKLEGIIDSRITKTMARLVATKEFKRTPAGSSLKQLAAPPRSVSR